MKIDLTSGLTLLHPSYNSLYLILIGMSQKLTLHPCTLKAGGTVPMDKIVCYATYYIRPLSLKESLADVFHPSLSTADRPEDAGLDDGAAVLCAEAERALRPLQLPRRLPRRRGRLHRERGLRRRQGQRRSVMNADKL